MQGQLVLLLEQQAGHHLERGPARLFLLHSAHTANHQDKRGHQQSSTDPEIPSQPPATLLPNHKPPLPKRTQFKSMVPQLQLVVPPWKIATSLDNICDLKKSTYRILVLVYYFVQCHVDVGDYLDSQKSSSLTCILAKPCIAVAIFSFSKGSQLSDPLSHSSILIGISC